MTQVIVARTRMEAWQRAAELLISGGEQLNLILDIERPQETDNRAVEIERLLNLFYSKESKPGSVVYPVHTVAETIFPGWLYLHGGLAEVYRRYPKQYAEFMKGDSSSWGRYAYRMMVRTDSTGRTTNPLAELIAKLTRSNSGKTGRYSSCYELNPALPEDDIAIFDSTRDGRRVMGQPCLMHLSFKMVGRQLHLTALYRNHDYKYKVPGNLLGLARLQAVVAAESGLEIGSLVVHSTRAYVSNGSGIRRFRELLASVSRVCASGQD